MFETMVVGQVGWINWHAHGSSPMRQGVGCPLTIVEEHARSGWSYLMVTTLASRPHDPGKPHLSR